MKQSAKYRLTIVALLGFSSGLPLALTSSALQGWFTQSGINIVTIGFLSLLGWPYIIKFLWAGALDRYQFPFLGLRRGWLLVSQIAVLLAIMFMSFFNPIDHLQSLCLIAFAVVMLSATQDIGVDAYRTEILHAEERGMGAALASAGYRTAMLMSGGLTFIMADHIGWQKAYFVMALLMLVGIVTTLLAPNPINTNPHPKNLKQAFVEPYKEFFSRDNAIVLALFIVLFKLGDEFALTIAKPFLLDGVGFSASVVGYAEMWGIAVTLIGGFVGAGIMLRRSMFQSLIIFGVLQAGSNLTFMALAMLGHNYSMMIVAVTIEYLAKGMAGAGLVAWLMSLCNTRYTAAQFAIFTALAAIGRVTVGPFAGVMVQEMGWVSFYFWTFIISMPGLLLLLRIRPQFELTMEQPAIK